ncbi:RING finger protein 165 [Zea mays]|uniref:RING-type E3 ubiquitin transferase n=1 Tax=Zea mays TaxID=4577 RepID=C0P717_MAIZE|nr:RING finger protein 165 [Zea mays]ACN28783.1 unknown [Zea mays]ONM21572.1 RING/U-box superfamily protein [Zea mays]|eukprot:NP_001288484.1 RING finger protein 165 [Zea mays]
MGDEMSDGRRADGSYGPEYGPVPREFQHAWYPQLPSRTRRRSPWPLHHGDYPWRLSEHRFRRPPFERSSSWHPLQPPFHIHRVHGSSGSGAPLNPRHRRGDAGLTNEEFREAMDQLRKDEYRQQQKHGGGGRGNLRTGKETSEEEKVCTICLETFLPGEQVAVTPCNHTFHQGCIAPWVQGHGSCPVCRFALCERSVADEDGGGMDLDLLAMVMAMEEAFSRFRFSDSTQHYH